MKKLHTEIVESASHDPWQNLAIEEFLLDRVKPGSMTLYLWQNERTVVIGRNQNAWRECRTDLLEREGGRLARRLSGGGAVYHDLGNCNYTFLAKPKSYDFERQVKVLIATFRLLGIEACFGGRNDITVEGRKVSGNAFYRGRSGRFQHGTILVSVDMERMARYLSPSKMKLASKGVASVRSRVANLSEIRPGISVGEIREALGRVFQEEFGAAEILDAASVSAEKRVAELREKYAGRPWVYGKSPDFDMQLEHRFDWGEVQIGLTVKGGHVAEGRVFSDAMDAGAIAGLGAVFKGAEPNAGSLAEKIRTASPRAGVPEVNDILAWLDTAEPEI
ncbi:MAG: lipoate--protein ligase [Synergistales bacterium]